MVRYILVLHKWFVGSNGFEIIDLGEKSIEDACMWRDAEIARKTGVFCSCAGKLIEIDKDERPVDRQLSWKERLSGRLRRRREIS